LGAVRGGAVEALRAVGGGLGDIHDALPVVEFGVQRRRFAAADLHVPARFLAQAAEGDAAFGRLLPHRVVGTVDRQVGSGRRAVDRARRARGGRGRRRAGCLRRGRDLGRLRVRGVAGGEQQRRQRGRDQRGDG